MPGLKQRAKTLVELADNATIYAEARPLALEPKARALLDAESRARLAHAADALSASEAWTQAALEGSLRRFADGAGVPFGRIAQPLRAALTGRTVSPGLFEVMETLGREESLGRIRDAASAPG